MNDSQNSDQPSPQPPTELIGEPTAAPDLAAENPDAKSGATADVTGLTSEETPQIPPLEDSAAGQEGKESSSEPAIVSEQTSDAPPTEVPIEPSNAASATLDIAVEETKEASSLPEIEQTETKATTVPMAKKAATAKPTKPSAKSEKSFLQQVLENKIPINGKVIGWNKGGFHIVVDGVAAFCPRSEMELGNPREEKSYVDEEFEFLVLKIQENGRRIIVSRTACLLSKRSEEQKAAVKGIEVGAVLEGTVATITEFGAFVDLNGVQGLVHVSELSQRRIEKTEEVVQVGQTVKVKVLKLSNGGKRISLSMKALEPNPWQSILERYPGGSLTKGRVERTNRYGAFIELEPGITGLLPASGMSLPRDTSPERAYPPGKQLSVQIISIDSKRQRISLGLEGSSEEGSRKDYQKFAQKAADETSSGFNALASAFAKIQDKAS